jgi:hypothetical protein
MPTMTMGSTPTPAHLYNPNAATSRAVVLRSNQCKRSFGQAAFKRMEPRRELCQSHRCIGLRGVLRAGRRSRGAVAATALGASIEPRYERCTAKQPDEIEA